MPLPGELIFLEFISRFDKRITLPIFNLSGKLKSKGSSYPYLWRKIGFLN